MDCNFVNDIAPPSDEHSNEMCHVTWQPTFRRCNPMLKSSFIDTCGECLNGTDDSTTEETYCGTCFNDVNADVLQTQYDYFYCNNSWRHDVFTEIVAFGNLPHLNWYEIAGSAQTVYLDMAASSSLHLYGPTWSYKRAVFENVSCIVQSIKRNGHLNVNTTLEEDHLDVSFTLNHTTLGDYSMHCKLQQRMENNHHMVSPIAQLSVVDSRLVRIDGIEPERITNVGTGFEEQVFLNGSGFVDSNQMWCFYVLRPSAHARLLSKAQYISRTRVSCNISTIQVDCSSVLDIGVIISSAALPKLNR